MHQPSVLPQGKSPKSGVEARICILTPYDKGRHPAWLEGVDVFQPMADDYVRDRGRKVSSWYRVRRQLYWVWRLFCVSRNYDAVLLGSDRVGLLFAAIHKFLRRRRVHVIFIDFLVNVSPDLRHRRLKRLLYRWAVEGATRVLVQRCCEVQLYSEILNVPAQKFVFVPYHATIYDTAFECADRGYIFSGGDGHRDYPLLLEAVRGLSFPVIIAALQRDHFRGQQIPPNVHIRSATEAEYIQLMAGARVVVVPLKSMPQHVGGEQTYANALAMGKPVIVTDLDADDYIDNGVNGVLTAPGDMHELRRAIAELMTNPGLAREIGNSAKRASLLVRPERFFDDVFRVCGEAVGH